MANNAGNDSFKWQLSKNAMLVMCWYMMDGYKDLDGIIMDGAVRSGKTFTGSFSFVNHSFHILPDGGGTFAFCGATQGSVRRNIVMKLMEHASTAGYSIVDKPALGCIDVTQISNGAKNRFFLFGGDDESKYKLIQGLTLDGVFMDEVTLMVRSFFDMALSRLSTSHSTMWFSCNPSHPSHWFKTDFIDDRYRKRLLYTHWRMEDNLSLTQQVLARYKRMWTGIFFERYVLGKWVASDGIVYSAFDRNTMTENNDIEMQNRFKDIHKPVWVSMDYGIQNPTAFAMFGWDDERMRFVMLKDWAYGGRDSQLPKTDDELYQELVSFCAGYAVQSVIIDPSASSMYELIRKAQQFRIVKADNSVNDGISFTNTMFSQGKLAIGSKCKATLNEIVAYSWDTKKSQETGIDTVIKQYDHNMDAMRYFCNTIVRPKSKAYGIATSRFGKTPSIK